jgi:polar amino acid transport system substrate-binding protein
MKILWGCIFVLILGGLLVGDVHAEIPSEIILATTDWCPYTCGLSAEEPGIVGEYITRILRDHNITVTIQSYPWTRAITIANDGEVHGLLTAIHEEAPELLFTDAPIMSYTVCFFTNTHSDWRYEDITSLSDSPNTLGVIGDYGYGSPVDEYIRNPNNQDHIHVMSGTDALKRLMRMLEAGRVDIILDDKNVVLWVAKNTHIAVTTLRNAGCLPENPFFLAINPTFPWSQELIDLLNQAFSKAENQEMLTSIIEKYVASE